MSRSGACVSAPPSNPNLGCLWSKRSLLPRGNRSLTVEQEVAEETEAREPCLVLLNRLGSSCSRTHLINVQPRCHGAAYVLSANGAAFSRQPGAAPQDSWHLIKTPALKARFTSGLLGLALFRPTACPHCYRARMAYAKRFGQDSVAGGYVWG